MQQFTIYWSENVDYECSIITKEEMTKEQVLEIFLALNDKKDGMIVLEDGCKVGLEQFCMDNGEKSAGSMAEEVYVEEN